MIPRLMHVAIVAVAAFVAAVPAVANDGADHSRNMKLVSNSPATSALSQSDLAFWGDIAYAGSYEGFRVLDISDPRNIRQLADVRCRGAQGDVTVWDGLLFVSVDHPTTTADCAGVPFFNNETLLGASRFEGIRIFDVSDPTAPAFVGGVATDCGSHTHTLVPDLDEGRVLLYVSSFPEPALFFGPTPFGTSCERLAPDGSPTGHSKISIVSVPLDDPASAAVVAEPTFELSDVHGTSGLRGCHDIQVFLELEVAAAACLSEGQLWDISDPLAPVTIERLFHPDVDIWHSAAFTWDGEVVVFGDEFAGGGGPGCDDPDDSLGRVYFYDRADAALLGTYKIPRPQEGQICTMHQFNVIPVRDRYALVSASNDGGTTVVDFTDPANAIEVGYYDAQLAAGPRTASPWSSYWYNGFIYANDRGRGVDVLRLSDKVRAGARSWPYLNPQTQESLGG